LIIISISEDVIGLNLLLVIAITVVRVYII